MPIQILPDTLVARIAAGEVVERPASVVKELVENAIDAGSRDIKIECAEGGRRLIRISDDGSGIRTDEVTLAFMHHATSKLRSVDDLSHIMTLGFRAGQRRFGQLGDVQHASRGRTNRHTHPRG